ncbi:protein TolR [Amaricoccus sp. W119]|uniref:protein TolR n=1 Tax=Amaricoccus sp. W119 TaxID=3391833 RepID=UPI0039A596C7
MAASLQGTAPARRRRRRGTGRGPMAEINVTPMVDVMLVLLIIFMVAAPMLTVGVPVQLPRTAAAALPAEQEEPLTISLTREGGIVVQSSEIEREDFIPRLRAVAAERTNDKVFLRADGGIPYSEVMQVMGALNASGFNDIGLVTEQGGPSFGGATSGGATSGGSGSGEGE